MATKTTAKKKTTASKGGKTTVSTKAKKAVKNLPVGVYKEKNPDSHKVSGKYTFFYVLFACTTLIFAGVATWLFIFSSELLGKYESIETCARNHTKCEVRYTGEEETAEENN